MKYLYTPQDIAVFALVSDFTQSDERYIIRDIWENDKRSISAKYRQDFNLFQRHIQLELSKIDGALSDIDELNILMRDTEHTFCIDGSINEYGIIESCFKIIKLELTYVEGKDYRKIKLRRLLKKFGYKRRSSQLIEHIQRTLTALGLKTFLKGHVPCNIEEINIDDMVMIRLKQGSVAKDTTTMR